MIDRAVIEERLTQCRRAKQQRVQTHAQIQAALTENEAQIHALDGREAELQELLALLSVPVTDGNQ